MCVSLLICNPLISSLDSFVEDTCSHYRMHINEALVGQVVTNEENGRGGRAFAGLFEPFKA